MRGDSTALEEDLHRGIRETNVDLFMDQLVRNTVVVMVHFNVIVDIDSGPFPLGINIGMNWEGFENRFFEGFEEDLTGTFELLKGPVIESVQLLCHSLFEFIKAEEGSVPKRGQNPVFHLEHAGFDLGLVLGSCHAGRNNDGSVMRC
jgi:hypothetical protein